MAAETRHSFLDISLMRVLILIHFSRTSRLAFFVVVSASKQPRVSIVDCSTARLFV